MQKFVILLIFLIILLQCSFSQGRRSKNCHTTLKYLPISIVITLSFFSYWLLCPDNANSGPYLNSAHGDTSYGVNRKATSIEEGFGYLKGNCAHCHEQHASIGGAEPSPSSGSPSKVCLFAKNFNTSATAKPYYQSDSVCFYCHYGTGTYQTPAFSNYTYSATFGGCSTGTDCPTGTIFEAFNNTSYHNLNDMLNFAKATWSSTFTANSNPCSACHNVHIAKRNKAYTGNPAYTAISKPSDHSNLWGDDSPGERMSNSTLYGTNYQPPYYYGLTKLEPDGVSSDRATQAEKTPDYIKFCTDCHNATNTISSAVLGTLKKIDWETTGGDSAGGDKHGKNTATTNICVDPPYNSTSSCTTSGLGKVLSCTDCHEPHGAPNSFLIRKEVNGGVLSTVSTGTSYGYLCRQCHMDDLDYDSTNGTANHWEAVHHCAGDYPYNQSMCMNCHTSGGKVVCGGGGGGGGGGGATPINCSNCHFHGSWVNDPNNPNDKTPDFDPTTRRTF